MMITEEELPLPRDPEAVARIQLDELLKQSASSAIVGYLTGLISAIALFPVAPMKPIIVWMVLFTGLYGFRWHFSRSRLKLNLTAEEPSMVLNHFVLLNFVTAVVWGILPSFYASSWPTFYHIVIWLIMTGVAASTISSYSIYRPAFLAFMIPLLTLTFWFLVIRNSGNFDNSMVLGLLLGAYSILVLKSGKMYGDILTSNIINRMELEHVNQALQKQAEHDPLTQLLNRRGFDSRLKTEWHRHARQEQSMAALMVDIDHFKKYNDHYGHDAGDQCIRRIAQALHSSAQRAGDLVARYGGEEFIVLLTDVQMKQARVVAERLRKAVESLDIPHAGSPTAKHVTVSIGVSALVPDSNQDESTLYMAADRKLYEAKNSGRNRIAY